MPILLFDNPLIWIFCIVLVCAAALRLLRRGRGVRRPAFLTWKRIALSVLPVLVLGASVPVNVVAYREAWGLVHPFKNPAQLMPESAGINHYEDVRFSTPDDVTIAAWYVPGNLPASVIFLHGYRSNRARFLPEAALLNGIGFNVLLMDCRACGESSGSLNTFGLNETGDVRGALDFLNLQPGIDPLRTGLVGHSQGGATALLSAAAYPEIAAVVTISTFTSLEDNLNSATRHFIDLPPEPIVNMIVFWGEWITGLDLKELRPIDTIAEIAPRPLLIAHGEEDDWVPVENAYRLFEAAGEPKELLIVPGAGHSNVPRTGGATFSARLIEFFQHALLENLID